MKRQRFGKVMVGAAFMWCKRWPSLHLKCSDETAVILDDKSAYRKGAVVTMSDHCLVTVVEFTAEPKKEK